MRAREILDEIEGISRLEKGKKTLVFDDAGKLSTGYEGKKNVVNVGYRFTAEGVGSRSSAWAYRDELQQRLVRQARRLPYEVPAFYAADKYITRPLFGESKQETAGPKKKWYDPSRGIDIAKDLAVTSLFQMGGFMLPTAALGAAKESSLNFYRTAQQRLSSANATGYSNITRGMTKHSIYEKSLNLQGMLEGVGQDLFSILDKSIKFSERSSGALSSAFLAMNEINKNPVAALYSQRHGAGAAGGSPKPPRKQTIQNLARDIYNGDKAALNRISPNPSVGGFQQQVQGIEIDSLLDLIPGYKSVRQGAKSGLDEYKKLGIAQKFLDESGRFDPTTAIQKILGPNATALEASDALGQSILNIQRKRSSDIFSLLSEFTEKTGFINPRNSSFTVSNNFTGLMRQTAYRDKLQESLRLNGLSENVAKNFARNITITKDVYKSVPVRGKQTLKEFVSPTERLRFGDEEIVGEDFFGELISRFNSGKLGKNTPLPNTFTKENLRAAVDQTDDYIYSHKNMGILPNVLTSNFRSSKSTFEKEVFSSVLKPRKLNKDDFGKNYAFGPSAGAYTRRMEMAQRTGKFLGLDEATIDDPARLGNALRARGINLENDAQLRAYLLNNKQMTDGATSGLAGFFGLQGLTLDRFLNREDALAKKIDLAFVDDQLADIKGQITQNILAGSTKESALLTSIKSSISQTTLSDVKGYYQFGSQSSTRVVNFNPIKSGFRKITEALATEVRVPVLGINPMQMLGYKDFAGMTKAGKYQVFSGSSNQPFVKGSQADFYTWHSTGGFLGTKGRIYGHTTTLANGKPVTKATVLEGSYRPLPTAISSMSTGTAELAAGKRTEQSRTATGFIGKVKERLDYAEEQPNSLFKFVGRLVNRQADVNNDAVMAKLISNQTNETFSIGGFGRKKNLQLRSELDVDGNISKYNLIDVDSGAQVGSHSELMEAFTRFANRQLSYGTNKSVQREVLGKNFTRNDAVGLTADDITDIKTPAQRNKVFVALEDAIAKQKDDLTPRIKGDPVDPVELEKYQQVAASFARIKNFADIDDFSKQSRMFEKSSSIVTKGDELSSEVFRFLLERKAILTDDPLKVMQSVSSAIDELSASGVISSAQKAEAQASTLSTLLNLTAFRTYRFNPGADGITSIEAMANLLPPGSLRLGEENLLGVLQNPLRRFQYTQSLLAGTSLKSLADPYVEGSIASSGQSSLFSQMGINKPLAVFKKNFAMGRHVNKPSASSLSGQSGPEAFTFVPTFGTALKRNPKATLLSASGIQTYGNEEGFSLASVPMSHGFNRLNRYFGSVGSSLNPDNFHGPLDMYFRGMNAERVLPAVAIGTTALTIDRTLGG